MKLNVGVVVLKSKDILLTMNKIYLSYIFSYFATFWNVIQLTLIFSKQYIYLTQIWLGGCNK